MRKTLYKGIRQPRYAYKSREKPREMTAGYTEIEGQVSNVVEIDLQAYGFIGFQECWLSRQGSSQRNLIADIVQGMMWRNIEIAGITTEDDRVAPGMPEDRLGFLRSLVVAAGGRTPYLTQELGEQVLSIEREGKKLYLINAQLVHALDSQGTLVKHLVVGTNRVPNGMPLGQTIDYCNDEGLMHFLMPNSHYPQFVQKLGAQYTHACTGLVGCRASERFPSWYQKLPVIGKHTEANARALETWCDETGRPGVAVSGAHTPLEIGRASITLPRSLIDTTSEQHILQSIKHGIETKQHEVWHGHESLGEWLSWALPLKRFGGNPHRFANEPSSYNLRRETNTFYNYA